MTCSVSHCLTRYRECRLNLIGTPLPLHDRLTKIEPGAQANEQVKRLVEFTALLLPHNFRGEEASHEVGIGRGGCGAGSGAKIGLQPDCEIPSAIHISLPSNR